jgi:CBS domain-containing protein
MFVEAVLAQKGDAILSIAPDSSVYDALVLMAEKNIGALLVMQDDNIAGILSERDYARKIIIKGKTSKETLVSEVMTNEVCCVGEKTPLEECMAVMTAKRIRHLPVLNEAKLVGLVSIGDVVKGIIDEQDLTIEGLYQYIHGIY